MENFQFIVQPEGALIYLSEEVSCSFSIQSKQQIQKVNLMSGK